MNWMVDGTPYSTPWDEQEAFEREQDYENYLDSLDYENDEDEIE